MLSLMCQLKNWTKHNLSICSQLAIEVLPYTAILTVPIVKVVAVPRLCEKIAKNNS